MKKDKKTKAIEKEIDKKILELEELKQRRLAMLLWKQRFDRLQVLHKINNKRFCDLHGFDKTYLCKQINGERSASPQYFKRVEELLLSYGV